MKILFLTQIIPYPPDAGPKVKTWNVLKFLKGNGHEVTLVSFVRPEEAVRVPKLREIFHSVYTIPIHRSRLKDIGYMLRSSLTGRPFLVERDDLQRMQEMVNRLFLKENFDVIHADQLTMVQFALRMVSKFPDKKTKIIFDAHNAVWTIVERMQENSPWWLRIMLKVETKRVKRYEGELLKTVDHVLAVTDLDRDALEEALNFSNVKKDERVAPVTIIPIAVDTQQLQPIKRNPTSKNIVTLGTLHYPPNADGIRWFLNEVLPLIRENTPDATLTIIGKNPPQDFLDAATRFPETIKVTGYVPELEPYFEQSALMVVPVRAGGGMRVRILEAFAYAMPVVTTTVGLEGIHAELEKDVLVADTAVAFANRVSELLENIQLQGELSENGRNLAVTKYDWQAVLSAMKPIYE